MKKPTQEEALMHFGVKGMKWGVRRKRSSSDGGETPSSRKTTAADVAKGTAKAARTATRRTVKTTLWSSAIAAASIHLMNPKILQMGDNIVKSVLDELGIVKMNSLERFQNDAEFRIEQFEAEQYGKSRGY